MAQNLEIICKTLPTNQKSAHGIYDECRIIRWYALATCSRRHNFLGFFCKRALWKRRYSAKETYNFMEPSNRSHPILHVMINFMRIQVRLELDWKFLERISSFCATLSAIGCTVKEVQDSATTWISFTLAYDSFHRKCLSNFGATLSAIGSTRNSTQWYVETQHSYCKKDST